MTRPHVTTTRLMLAAALVLGGALGVEAQFKLPPSGPPASPTEPRECQELRQEWSEYWRDKQEAHNSCLASHQGSSRSNEGADFCDVAVCQSEHSYLFGVTARLMKDREKGQVAECDAAVSRHQKDKADEEARQRADEQAAQRRRADEEREQQQRDAERARDAQEKKDKAARDERDASAKRATDRTDRDRERERDRERDRERERERERERSKEQADREAREKERAEQDRVREAAYEKAAREQAKRDREALERASVASQHEKAELQARTGERERERGVIESTIASIEQAYQSTMTAVTDRVSGMMASLTDTVTGPPGTVDTPIISNPSRGSSAASFDFSKFAAPRARDEAASLSFLYVAERLAGLGSSRPWVEEVVNRGIGAFMSGGTIADAAPRSRIEKTARALDKFLLGETTHVQVDGALDLLQISMPNSGVIAARTANFEAMRHLDIAFDAYMGRGSVYYLDLDTDPRLVVRAMAYKLISNFEPLVRGYEYVNDEWEHLRWYWYDYAYPQ
jgi:hypothetical protein